MKTLNKQIARGRQSLDYRETLEHKGKKVRVRIQSDSYDFQSYAIVELFDGGKWNQLDIIPFSEMETNEGLYYKVKDSNLSKYSYLFQKDRDKLIKLAQDVLD
jgi:hypothetical protein